MPHEVGRFLENNKHDSLYPLYLVALNTGLRRGELPRPCAGIGGKPQGAEAVAFEVKTTLIKDNVTKFLGKLKDFKANCSNFVESRTVYGGVAEGRSRNGPNPRNSPFSIKT